MFLCILIQLLLTSDLTTGRYNPPIVIPLIPLLDFFPEYDPAVILKRAEQDPQYNATISTPLAETADLLLILVATLQDQASVEYNVIVDTGSSDLLIYANPCTADNATGSGYPCPSNKFNPTTNGAVSYSCNNVDFYPSACVGQQAQTTVTYGGGNSYKNYIWTYNMRLKNELIFSNIIVGGTYQVTKPIGGVDGLFGLCFASRSATNNNSQLFTMLENENLYPAFRMVMNVSGGAQPQFILGQDDTLFPSMKFYPTLSPPNDWSISLSQVTVSGSAVTTGSTSILIDSGTSGIIFTSTLFNAIKTAMQANCGTNYLTYLCGTPNIFTPSTLLHPTQAEIAQYPQLAVYLNGDQYILPPSLYLYYIGPGIGGTLKYQTLLFSSNLNILGAGFLQGYVANFDVATLKIGFAPNSALVLPTPAPTTPVPSKAPSPFPTRAPTPPTVPTGAPTSSSHVTVGFALFSTVLALYFATLSM